MKLDSAMNLQADLFKNAFGFVEMPEPIAHAMVEQDIPTYVHPRVLDNQVVFVESFAVSEDAPGVKPLADISEGQVLAIERDAGTHGFNETDGIALGIGAGNAAQAGDYQIVAIYQDRALKKHPILAKIEEQSRGEARIMFGGKARAFAPWHREFNATLRMGSSIGHKKVTAGTLGCFVGHRDNGKIGVLSNNHVLADVNNASVNDEIRQPGSKDGGTEANRMASLEAFIPIQFGGVSNQLDCAWASHDNPARAENRDDRFDSAENVVGQLASNAPRAVLPGDFVMKTGRTTGYTQGEVDAINFGNLNVDMGNGAIARFDGQIQIKSLSRVPFSRRGDSGSLIVNIDSEPVGLLFAGSTTGGFENTGFTWANPIDGVLNQLNLEIRV